MQTDIPKIHTLGELKKSGYQTRSIRDELRHNLIQKLQAGAEIFPGIHGYQDTVIPELQRAILSRHNILLLGLRGQAKTRIARLLVHLLDPFIPVIEGSELQDDPFHPVSRFGKDLIATLGDKTPVQWIPAENRYVEKLATPDVSVADLIGDADPILASNLRLPWSDERVIHFGLIPRANRSIFVINELPDLQARIQVALFNILQEGDIQIRGFNVRMPLDIQFVFTANPEDYTHRGSIVTPLKDRIDSQILTHYPKEAGLSKKITLQEAKIPEDTSAKISVPDVMLNLLEQIATEARKSEYVDQKSGVSARMNISAYENLISTADLRRIQNHEASAEIRIADLQGIIPSLTGKMELVYEGELEGPALVARNLIGKAIRHTFLDVFPNPAPKKGKNKTESPYREISDWFAKGNLLTLNNSATHADWTLALNSVPGLNTLAAQAGPENIWKELILHGLSECSVIGKTETGPDTLSFRDMLSGMFSNMNEEYQPDSE